MDTAKRKLIIYKTVIILFSAVLLCFGIALYLIREYVVAGIFALTAIVNIVRTIRDKSGELGIGAVFAIGFNIALTLYGSRRTFIKHQEYVCSDKFGPEFNARRQNRDVPVIPHGWRKLDSGRFTRWEGDTSAFGHYSKDIMIDSACRIEIEDDSYKLKPLNGVAREMSVRMKYALRRGDDSLFYYYRVGDSTQTITRQKADSLFAIENIQSDY